MTQQSAVSAHDRPFRWFAILCAAFMLSGCLGSSGSGESLAPLTSEAKSNMLDADGASLLRIGQSFEAAGDLAGAMRLYQRAARKLPNSAEPQARMGDMMARANRNSEAWDFYQAGLAIEPGHPGLHLGLAKLEIASGREDEAVARLLTLKNAATTDPEVFIALGLAYDLIGDHDAARTAYGDALDLDAKNGKAIRSLALSFAITSEYETAAGLLKVLVNHPIERRQARISLALIYVMSDQAAAGRQLLGFDLSPDQVHAMMVKFDRMRSLEGSDRAAAIHLGRLPILRTAAAPPPASEPAPRETTTSEPSEPTSADDQIGAEVIQVGREATSGDRRVQPAVAAVPPPAEPTPVEPKAESVPAQEPDSVTAETSGPAAAETLQAEEPTVPLTADGYRIQIAAFSSLSRAQRGWAILSGEHPSVLEGQTPVLQPVEVGERTLYRLQLDGFEDGAAALAACEEMRADELACSTVAAGQGAFPLPE